MKAAAGLNESRFVDLSVVQRMFPDVDANNFAQQVSDAAVTLVRTNGRVLPLPRTKSGNAAASKSDQGNSEGGLVVVSFVDSKNSRLGHEFDHQLNLHRPDARVFHYYNDHIAADAPSEVLSQATAAGTVVIAAFVTHVPGRQVIFHGRLTNAVGLSGDSAELLEDLVAAASDKTVVVALGSPYLIQNYPKIENYICTYSLEATAETSAVRSLFGEIQNHAHLPVTLPGIAPRGFALPWPTPPVQRTQTVH